MNKSIVTIGVIVVAAGALVLYANPPSNISQPSPALTPIFSQQTPHPQSDTPASGSRTANNEPTINPHFADVSRRAGFHIFFPSSLPNGFALDPTTLVIDPDGDVSFSIKSTTTAQIFFISEKPPGHETDIVQDVNRMKSRGWSVEESMIGADRAYIARPPSATKGSLLFTKLSVYIDMLADPLQDVNQLVVLGTSMR